MWDSCYLQGWRSKDNKKTKIKKVREYVKEYCMKNWSVAEGLLKLASDCKIEMDCEMQGSRNENEKKIKKAKHRKDMKEGCVKIWNVLERWLEVG